MIKNRERISMSTTCLRLKFLIQNILRSKIVRRIKRDSKTFWEKHRNRRRFNARDSKVAFSKTNEKKNKVHLQNTCSNYLLESKK